MTDLALIAGVARNGAIGRNNQLLWRLPEDLIRFKALTMGHPVVMGRNTWDSLPARFRPLPGRRNIVLSRTPGMKLDGAEVFPSLADALAACEAGERVFVIGGAQIYAQALPLAKTLELTEIDADFEADTFFPAWDRKAFREVARDTKSAADLGRYDFVTYERN